MGKSAFLLAVFACVCAFEIGAMAQGTKSMVSLSVKTKNRGKSTTGGTDGNGMTVRQTTRSLGVVADLFFFQPPTSEYEIQCFFVASDENTKEKFLYGAQVVKASDKKKQVTFDAPTLGGTVKRSASLPFNFEATTASGGLVTGTGTLYFNSSAAGATTYGWVVRLVQGGEVLKIETNQAALRQLAERSPQYFDAAFK